MEGATVLYIHGMGGGGDSRIPSILRERIAASTGIKIIVRTYDFEPETAEAQIRGWVDELRPSLIIGESLGAIQAMRITGLPHIFVSPSLGGPLYLGYLSFITFIPGVTALLDRIYRPREGDRQPLHFSFRNLRGYLEHRRKALENSPLNGSKDSFFAFFGTKDHYRRSGVVSIRMYRKYFGDDYEIYDGTHFMEEEYVEKMLIPKIMETLLR